MNKCALATVSAFGLAASPAFGASFVQNFLVNELGAVTETPITFILEDDDATTFVDNTPGTPSVLVGGVLVPGIDVGDVFEGSVIFPSIEFGGGAEFTLNASTPFELTGVYSFTVTSIGPGTAGLVGSLDVYEDDTPDADFGGGAPTGFADGTLFASFDVLGAVTSLTGILGSTASPLPPGAATGVAINALATVTPGGLINDPTLFTDVVDPSTLGFSLFGPTPGFDFSSDGNLTISATVVPSPAAAGLGLLGAVGLLASRRRKGA